MTKTAKIILISVLSLVMAALVFLCIRLGKSPEDIQNELSEETNTPTFTAEQALDTAQRLAAQAEVSCSDGSANLIALSDASGTVTVSSPGVYLVEGSLSDGQLIVDCTGEVILILNSAEINNSEDAAISVASAEHVLIYLPEGSENRLVSGTSQEITPASENEAVKSASGATLYAKDCLSIAGRGTLTAEGYINNGIATTDHLVVLGGSLDITAVNNGLKGKDSVTVLDGEITIEAGNDGIKSNNDTDSDCGNIDIRCGRITVTSLGDGIQAERDLSVADGTVTVISGGGSGEASGANSFDIPNGNFPTDFSGLEDGDMQQPPEMADGDIQPPEMPVGDIQPPEMPDGNMQPPEMPDGDTSMQKPQRDFSRPDDANRGGNGMSFPDGFDRDQLSDTDSGGSTKGLKCGQQLTVSGGTITVNSLDDSIHSNGTVLISGGTLSLASGDDGVHADDTLTIDGGSITVTQAYEGLEANLIFINGGNISITASDDGINANGGASMFGGFFGGGSNDSSSDYDTTPTLRLSGGTLYVNAGGDGLDSNGDLIVEGGYVIVEGPTNSGNGALDSGTENGGSLVCNGGTVLAIGASGMAETFEESSAQCSFIHILSSTAATGTHITVSDDGGNVIFEFTSSKSFSSVVFSSPELTLGETYTLIVGEEVTEITMENISNGESQGFGGGFSGSFGGGFGGRGMR